jgi:glucose dehydrogenase
MSPHDLYDHDGVNENVLVDLPLDGQQRKVLLHPDRNGYLYVIDRTTGQVLSATPFVHITSSKGVEFTSTAQQIVLYSLCRMGTNLETVEFVLKRGTLSLERLT